MVPIDLIIFDCDGVLVDSEKLANQHLRDFIAELGWDLSLQVVLSRFKGRSIVDIWREVATHIGRPITAAEDRDHRSRQLQLFRERLEPVPGARELLAALPVPFCVASNGPPEKLETSLDTTGLLPWVRGRVFSRVSVSRPKPYPDLFLHAAAQMAVDPKACLVVEDSPLGIRAALAAGMRPLGFCGTATADETELRAAGADAIVHNHGELLTLVR